MTAIRFDKFPIQDFITVEEYEELPWDNRAEVFKGQLNKPDGKRCNGTPEFTAQSYSPAVPLAFA